MSSRTRGSWRAASRPSTTRRSWSPTCTRSCRRSSGGSTSRWRTGPGASPGSPMPRPAIAKILPVNETVVVSETRTAEQLGDLPAQVTVLSEKDISQTAALTIDDFLKQVPSFSLFRRSSSLVSHPTTQGVSLRGIGASGVSRTLVLLDGVPFNDPVGSWVYWSKIPLL